MNKKLTTFDASEYLNNEDSIASFISDALKNYYSCNASFGVDLTATIHDNQQQF